MDTELDRDGDPVIIADLSDERLVPTPCKEDMHSHDFKLMERVGLVNEDVCQSDTRSSEASGACWTRTWFSMQPQVL